MSYQSSKYQRNQPFNNEEISGAASVQSIDQYTNAKPETNRYMPGLDGLRALAVFAVIAYHLNLPWAPGGLLGVCLFFVLSGYLITDILVTQWRASGRIDLKDFWLRRARRLLPALYVMLAGVILWTAIFAPTRLSTLWKDTLAALFYTSNWWLIFHHVSYFASFGPPSPLGHLWSLAVEEQFYLIWPLLLLLGLRFVPKRRRLVMLTLTLALISALAMALIYQPGMDPSRVYYGTDTRAFALLIGAALALVWPSHKLTGKMTPKGRFALDAAGGAGLLIVLMMIWKTNEYDTFLYQGGLFIFSLASAIVVAVLAHPGSRLGRLFGFKPLRWLGACSYGIYLWHYPVIALTSPTVNTGGIDAWLAVRQIAASIALAGLSWYFIEEPIRHGNRKKTKEKSSHPVWQQRLLPVNARAIAVRIFVVLGTFCLAIFFGGTLISHAEHSMNPIAGDSKPAAVKAEAQTKPGSNTIPGINDNVKNSSQKTESASAAKAENSKTKPGSRPNSSIRSSTTSKSGSGSIITSQSGKGITVIGDSVMVGVEPELEKLLPGVIVDAQVGRQLYQAQNVVENLKAQGKMGRKVIIELGTNGTFTEKQLTNLLDSLGQVQQIVLVNTRVPRPWQDVVNQTLAQAASSYPNTTLVNWYSASSGHNEYFYQDGVHLNQAGIKAYASLLKEAVN